MNECPFCSLPEDRVIDREGDCVAVYDLFPVSRGHTLIVPDRHVASFRELSEAEWASILRLAQRLGARRRQEDPSIAGFNLGINDGPAAGQTIFHAHVHLIPRRVGDVEHPEGGVRGVIPGRARYRVPGSPHPRN